LTGRKISNQIKRQKITPVTLEEENQLLRAENEELKEQVRKLMDQLEELKEKVGKNSRNSSKPPSSDGLRKPNRNRSLRESNKKFGGQVGHKGGTLEAVETPDKIEKHEVKKCKVCEKDLSQKRAERIVKRQVFDIEMRMVVTEHQAEIKKCECGVETVGEFPEEVRAATQIGEKAKAVALYLSEQFIAKKRVSETMRDVFQINISDTTLIKYEKKLGKNLKEFYEQSLKEIKEAEVKHQDETGIRVEGKTQWIQVLSTKELTYLKCGEKRKNLEEGLKGICVHDHYKPYSKQEGVLHAYCNAHHLRELKAAKERGEEWATPMYDLLKKMREKSKEEIEEKERKKMVKKYDQIILNGSRYHEGLEPVGEERKKRGRKKRRPGHNLIIRLNECKMDVLRFLFDSRVPFTNNQAERDLRMAKLKQKISGCLRTILGAESFVKIRSFINTLRKNKLNVFKGITWALSKPVTLFDFLPHLLI
jgi:transposase